MTKMRAVFEDFLQSHMLHTALASLFLNSKTKMIMIMANIIAN